MMLCGSLSLWVSLSVIKHERITAALLQRTMYLTVLLLYPCLPRPKLSGMTEASQHPDYWRMSRAFETVEFCCYPLLFSQRVCDCLGWKVVCVWISPLLPCSLCFDFLPLWLDCSRSGLQSSQTASFKPKRSGLSRRQTGVEWGLELKLHGFK